MGAIFSLVNVNPKFRHRILEGVRLQGLESRLTSVEAMKVERPGVFDIAMHDEDARAEVVSQFVAAARRGLERGAEVILPAGGSLMSVLIEAGVTNVDGAPVVNGVAALVKVAELAVGMRKLTGTFTSKHLVYAPPKGKLLQDVTPAYWPHVYPDPNRLPLVSRHHCTRLS